MRANLKKSLCALTLCAAITAAFTGCTGKESTDTTTEQNNSLTKQSAQTPTATTTTAPVTPENEPQPDPVEYPCTYTQEELHCTYDDKDIFGTLYTPEDGLSSHPAAILSHGYNCIGADMQDVAKKLAENGMTVYSFDYCGGSTRSASSGNSVDMSVETEQDDLRHVIDMVADLDSTDASRLYLYGESQGGFVAALTAAEMPDRIAGMVLIYPAFCIVDQWLAMDPDTMTEPFNFMGGMTLSKTFYDGVPRYDIYEHVSKFANPVIIYQGDKDQVVNVSYAQKLNEIFPDCSLTIVEGAGHGFGGDDRKNAVDGSVKFLTGLAAK